RAAARVRAREGLDRGAPRARAPLDERTAAVRAEDARWRGARAATLRERAAAGELPAPILPDDHRRAAQMTLVFRHHRLRALTLDRSRVLARLRMVLAGEEGPEEAAARLELSPAIRT